MVSHLSLRDSKSPHLSRTLLSILIDPNNAVVSVVSTRPLISKSSSRFINPLVSLPSEPITIGITVTFMFHGFSLLVQYLSFFSLSLSCGQPERQNPLFGRFLVLFFFLLLGLAEIRGSVCTSKFQRSLYVSFSRSGSGLCIYHLLVWSNLSFLHNSLWITFPVQSCLVLYSFCVSLLHSLIMWLIVLSLSPHNPHLLFCCV